MRGAFMDLIFTIIVPSAFILFWLIVFLYDRIKDAKIRRQFSKFKYHQEYEKPPKPWGIYILGILFAVLFLGFILFHIQKEYLNSYNQGYEDGFQAGIEEVQQNPGAYL